MYPQIYVKIVITKKFSNAHTFPSMISQIRPKSIFINIASCLHQCTGVKPPLSSS